MTDTDLIHQQMARIRHDLHQDVSGVRGGVAQVLDWRSLLRDYPLASICAALAVGFAVAPRRVQRGEEMVASLSDAPGAKPARPRRGVGSHALGLLWPIAEQAIQTCAAIWIEGWIRQHLGRGPATVATTPENRPGPRSGNVLVFTSPGDTR